MRFQFGDVHYTLRFKYDTHESTDSEGNKRIRHSTQCTINSSLSDDPKVLGDCLAVAVVMCDTRDNFCKAEGRKRSLTKAIASLDRHIRSIIWSGYFANVKDGERKLAAAARSGRNASKRLICRQRAMQSA